MELFKVCFGSSEVSKYPVEFMEVEACQNLESGEIACRDTISRGKTKDNWKYLLAAEKRILYFLFCASMFFVCLFVWWNLVPGKCDEFESVPFPPVAPLLIVQCL